MDFIKAAFETFKKHPLPWILLGLVFGMVQPFGGMKTDGFPDRLQHALEEGVSQGQVDAARLN